MLKIVNYKNSENLLILFFFIISRIIYIFFFEIRFDTWTIKVFDQFFPIYFLKNDLLQSLIYNHLQPPLLNLVTGILIKITNDYLIYINLIYLLCGLLNFLFFNKILIEFNFNKKKRLLLTIFLMVLPTTIIFENNFYKEYPSMCLMTILIYFSIKIVKLKIENKYISYKRVLLLTLILSLLSLLRETFHIFWGYTFLLLLGILIKENKKIIISFVLLNILVLPFYLKNYYLYDRFGMSLQVWRGMNNSVEYVKKMKTDNYNPELKKIIFKNDGNFNNFLSKMSPIYYETYYPNPSNYLKILNYEYKYSNPLLRSKTYFNEVFLKVDKLRFEDFKKFIKYYPEIIILQIPNTLVKYFFKSSDTYYYARPNIDKIPNLIRITNCLKLTLSCIYKSPSIIIQKKKILIPGTKNLYFVNDYYESTLKNQLLYNLHYTNFILVILYFFLIFFLLKKLFKKNNNKLDIMVNFWVLTFFHIFAIFLLAEKLEIPRQRFPFDYLSLIFLLYYIKNSNKAIENK